MQVISSDIAPTVLALDFDGVLCDGLKEYFLTAWRAHCQIWHVDKSTPPEGLAEAFYRLRPVVETGWEMPVLIRAIELQFSEADLLHDWSTIAARILQTDGLQPAQLASEVDGVRDRWIAEDLDSWLAEHEFYPGVIERLRSFQFAPTGPIIISTKEGRFIRQLLQRQGVEPDTVQIFGKEAKRPKGQILRELIASYIDSATFWFIEDRLKTLQGISQQPDLAAVQLFLADWGYNTQAERDSVKDNPAIRLLSLEQFRQDLSKWL